MTKTKSFSELSNQVKAEPRRRKRVDQYKHAMEDALALCELRKQRQMTQGDVAANMETSQANVSRIEHEDDLYLSTLRGYIAAMGGRLEINAVFPEATVPLVTSRKQRI